MPLLTHCDLDRDIADLREGKLLPRVPLGAVSVSLEVA